MISEYREGIATEINNAVLQAKTDISNKIDKILTEIELSVNDTIAILKGVDKNTSQEDVLDAIEEAMIELNELSLKLY